MIKHSISKIQLAIVWALNYYIIEFSGVPKQLLVEFQRVRDEMWYVKAHQADGAWSPDELGSREDADKMH